MLRTTIVKNELAWAWVLISFLLLPQTLVAQEDSLEETATRSQTGVFDKLFGSSSNRNKQVAPASQAKTPKPKVPATAVAGKPARSGFLVPLRSFTQSFRGPSLAEDSEELGQVAPQRMKQLRPPVEPFRNLTRTQGRRERENIDLQVEQLREPRVYSKDLTGSQPPIVNVENIRKPTAAPTASAPGNTKPVIAGNSKKSATEIVIESNSTSRRTAMDSTSSDTDIAETSTHQKPTSKAPSGASPLLSASQIKSRPEPRNLLDLGQETESSAGTPASPNAPMQPSKPDYQPQENGISKTSRPSNSNASKDESKLAPRLTSTVTSIPIPNNPKASNTTTNSSFHRETSIPGIRVEVNGPSSILVGESSRFEVIAINEGSETLNGLIVQLAVPSHVAVGEVVVAEGAAHPDTDQEGNTLIWELGQLPAGSSRTATVNLRTLKPEYFALGVEWTVQPQAAQMQIAVQQPQIAIALEGPSEVTFGKPQMYRIRVRNTGNADVRAVSVTVSAEPYGSNQSEIGDISAGSERVVEVELTFQQNGSLPIIATATSALSKLEERSAINVQVRQSELIATWYGPTEFYQGSVIDYELELTNAGSVPAQGTNCQIKLPSGADVVSLPTGASRSGDTIKWDLRQLEPGEKQMFPLRLSLSKIGENQLTFSANCSSSPEAKADVKTNIDAIADLQLTVVDPAAPAPVGQPVVYEIVIANRGKKSANDIEVIAQFSDGIEPVRVEGQTGRIVPGQAIFNLIPSIGPNERLVLRIHAEASKPGVHRFRAEVKSKGSDTDLLEEESTRYLATSIKGDRR